MFVAVVNRCGVVTNDNCLTLHVILIHMHVPCTVKPLILAFRAMKLFWCAQFWRFLLVEPLVIQYDKYSIVMFTSQLQYHIIHLIKTEVIDYSTIL